MQEFNRAAYHKRDSGSSVHSGSGTRSSVRSSVRALLPWRRKNRVASYADMDDPQCSSVFDAAVEAEEETRRASNLTLGNQARCWGVLWGARRWGPVGVGRRGGRLRRRCGPESRQGQQRA